MSTSEPLGVLIIEDDDDTRANLCDVLELDGHHIESASTAAEAFAERDWPTISVVILDRKLPDGTAEQLLPQLKARAPHAHVIVATGYADVQGAITALQNGAADYLLKPLRPELLRAAIVRIGERLRLERAKQRSEAALQTVIDASPCLIALLRHDCRIAYINAFAEALTGYSVEEVRDENYLSLFHAPEEQTRLEKFLANLRNGVEHSNFESPIHCRDGTTRLLLCNATHIPEYDGEAALLCIGLDVTARKQAEERALQAQRLAAIGETMAGLVHESRNALQRSRACLEMLALEVQDRPEALDLVERTQRAQEHLQHLYEEVRQYAAPLKLCRQSTDLGELWREIWHDLAVSRAERHLQLVEKLETADLHSFIDRFALGQVWRNILENAIQVSPVNGRVTIDCRETTLEGRRALEVRFTDEGPGLDPDQRHRIFEPFFTTKAKGTGLGMAIAHRIVSAHGGRITTADRAGPGAEIIVTLPRESE